MALMHVLITLVYINMIYLTFVPFATSVYFKISSFGPNTNDILYRGSAVPSSGAVQLNPVNYVCQVGQAIYAERVQMWDSSSGKVADFTTRFSFTIDTINQPTYGDGFAFFLGPADFQIPPNSAGSFLGLYNLSNYRDSSQNQMIHVEFDTFVDTDWDPGYEHVGINKNSIFSANNTGWNAGNHSGDVADVVISYSAQTKMLLVSWTYNNPTPETSSLSYQVDLKEVLSEWATIGFSAGTGNLKEKNTLLYWEFNSTLNGKYLPSIQGQQKSSRTLCILVSGAIGVVTGMVISIFIGFVSIKTFELRRWIQIGKRRRREKIPQVITLIPGSSCHDTENEARPAPRSYPYSELLLATNSFHKDHKLGEGGFGVVYKGHLSITVHKEVAIKKISEWSTQGENEFTAELETIGKLNHPNLLEFVGWCHEQDMFLLIYKNMANGSLDSYLYGEKKEVPLAWPYRYKIAQGLASALDHLHEGQGDNSVIHRDIKASNVMLDEDFTPKLGDFGLAKLMESNRQGSKATKLMGTKGYSAPEYLSSRNYSKATDIYSFGVTALEIGCGRSVADPDPTLSMDLVKWVRHLHGNKQLRSTVDKRVLVLPDFNEEEYNCLMMVGLLCTHDDPTKRSTIKEVVDALRSVKPPEIPADIATNDASSSGIKS